ncbi:MAG: FMN-binding protein [Treponema sp.]|nr:FMN-binding protein [Treponema sp.]
MIKLGLILAAYAVASCTMLAVVNSFTAPVIASNQQKKANAAMLVVLPTAEDFADLDAASCGTTPSGATTIEAVKLAKAGGKVIGGVIQISGPTYDHASVMIGVDSTGTVTGVQFLENTDSPGFGSKASDPNFTLSSGKTFYGQFAGKKVADGFVAGETFDAISGATITSKGVATLLDDGTAVLTQILKEHGND